MMERKKHQRIVEFLGIAVIAIAIFFLLALSFWSLYPYEVARVEEPIEILNEDKKISSSENIVLRATIFKPNDLRPEADFSVWCDDGNVYPLAPVVLNLPKGKTTITADQYALPPANAGASCNVRFTATYRVNPVREITKVWESEEFTVIEER